MPPRQPPNLLSKRILALPIGITPPLRLTGILFACLTLMFASLGVAQAYPVVKTLALTGAIFFGAIAGIILYAFAAATVIHRSRRK